MPRAKSLKVDLEDSLNLERSILIFKKRFVYLSSVCAGVAHCFWTVRRKVNFPSVTSETNPMTGRIEAKN